jgi:hypothetical protein
MEKMFTKENSSIQYMKCDHCDLNADHFRVNLINDSGCVCGWVIEDSIHFFLECCLYVEAREQLTNNLQFLDSLLIETLLFGDGSLSEEQNAQLFKSVQLYIKQTKRFTQENMSYDTIVT